MLDCLILGDSIGVGVAQQRPECVAYVKGGLNSWQWNRKFKNEDLKAKTAIISLGTNDHFQIRTIWELQQMRDRVNADRVFWILPPCNDKFCKPSVNRAVEIIAKDKGDTIIRTSQLQSDSIHPNQSGYKELANQTK